MEEEIKQVETISVPETPVQLPKKSNLSKIVLLFILGLIILAGAVYAGITIGKKQSPPEIIPQAVEASPTPDPTANWKTYEGDGFSFKYPENLISELNNQIDYSEVSVKDKDKLQLMVERWTKYPVGQKDYLLDTSSNGEKEVGNTTWKTYSLPNGYCDMGSCTLPIFGLQTEKNGVLYSLLFYGQSSATDQFDQILSTFKFTPGQNAVDETANWKTYTNTKYGYLFRYPESVDIDSEGLQSYVPISESPSIIASTKPQESEDKGSTQYPPHMTIVVISKKLPGIKDTSLQEIARDYYNRHVNDSGPGEKSYVSITKPLEKTNFKNKEAYKFEVKGSVLHTPYGSGVVYEGVYQSIWVEDKEFYVAIYFTNNDLFNQIVETIEFLD